MASSMPEKKSLSVSLIFIILLMSCTAWIAASPLRMLAEPQHFIPSSGPATIHVWTSWEGDPFEALLQVIDVFQKNAPQVSFDILVLPADELVSEYRTSVENGEGPDILIAPGSIGGSLYHSGLAVDLYPILGTEMEESLQPAAFRCAVWKDWLVGIPLVMDGAVMYRNASVIHKAPGTLDELEELSAAAGVGNKEGFFLDAGFYFTGGHLFGFGAELVDREGKPAFSNDQGSAWLSMISELQGLGPLTFNSDDDLKAFLSGNTGIIIDGTWNLKRIRQELGERLSIDPWPAAAPGRLSGFIQTDNAYLNPARFDPSEPGVLDFLRFLLSAESQMIFLEAGQIPAGRGLEVSDPLIRQVIDAFEGGSALPVDPTIDLYTRAMNTALQRLLYEDWPIDEILAQAEQDVLQYLEQQ